MTRQRLTKTGLGFVKRAQLGLQTEIETLGTLRALA
jgi:hypothetical protein